MNGKEIYQVSGNMTWKSKENYFFFILLYGKIEKEKLLLLPSQNQQGGAGNFNVFLDLV